MSPTYDVIIVGAGPAGGIAALRLSQAGARVLMLEKAPLGRDKPCGGGLTPRAWENFEIPIDDLVLARTDRAELRRAAAGPVLVDLRERPVLMVRRCALDERIALAAVRAGATLHDREPATRVDVDARGVTVSSEKGVYQAAALLLATGAEGSMRAALRLPPTTTTVAVGLEIEAPAQAAHLSQRNFVFDFGIPGGYAWAFPKRDWWNVGVMSARREVAPRLRTLLAAFVERVGVKFTATDEAVVRERGRRIPFHSGWRRLSTGRAAVLGDAAALADPLYGEGIAQAFVSGRTAAAAVEGLLRGEHSDLAHYETMLQAAIGVHLRRMRLISRGVHPAPTLAVRMLTFSLGRAVARRLATESFRPSQAV